MYKLIAKFAINALAGWVVGGVTGKAIRSLPMEKMTPVKKLAVLFLVGGLGYAFSYATDTYTEKRFAKVIEKS